MIPAIAVGIQATIASSNISKEVKTIADGGCRGLHLFQPQLKNRFFDGSQLDSSMEMWEIRSTMLSMKTNIESDRC